MLGGRLPNDDHVRRGAMPYSGLCPTTLWLSARAMPDSLVANREPDGELCPAVGCARARRRERWTTWVVVGGGRLPDKQGGRWWAGVQPRGNPAVAWGQLPDGGL
ncbi:hypothetical protein Dimus_028838 [Dionaea muscipula]